MLRISVIRLVESRGLSGRRAGEYTGYVAVANLWAKECGDKRADEIERALFYLGPKIRRAWMRYVAGPPE